MTTTTVPSTTLPEPTPSSTTESAQARDARLVAISTATARAVAEDPARATVRFAATGRAVGAVATDVRSRQHDYVVDEPASLGGDDSATNPVEYALGAFIGCQVVTYRFWAARLGIALDGIEISASGDLDVRGFFGLGEVRPGFAGIELDVLLTGPENPERYTELQAVVDAHCPVLDLVANPTPVRTVLRTA